MFFRKKKRLIFDIDLFTNNYKVKYKRSYKLKINSDISANASVTSRWFKHENISHFSHQMYKCSVFDSIPYNIIYTRNLGNDIHLQPTINERVNYTYDINEQDDKKIAEQVRAEDKAIGNPCFLLKKKTIYL